jgi:hypothetical protein
MEPEIAGGRGTGLFSDPVYLKQDLAMVRRAIKKRWPIPRAKRLMLLERLFDIAETSNDNREVINAAKTVLMADGINAKWAGAGEKATTNNTQFNVTLEHPAPAITEQGRIEQVVAFLERIGQGLGGSDAIPTAADEIHPQNTAPAPSGLPSPGMP